MPNIEIEPNMEFICYLCILNKKQTRNVWFNDKRRTVAKEKRYAIWKYKQNPLLKNKDNKEQAIENSKKVISEERTGFLNFIFDALFDDSKIKNNAKHILLQLDQQYLLLFTLNAIKTLIF